MMFVDNVAGTVDSPEPFDPQAITTPFVRSASECMPPTATADTPFTFIGIVV